jgi:hypothetical protein
MVVGEGGKGWCGGVAVRWHARGQGWVRAETTETERVCSVSGVPYETVGDGVRWGGVVAMVVVVWPSGGMSEARWVRAETTETE